MNRTLSRSFRRLALAVAVLIAAPSPRAWADEPAPTQEQLAAAKKAFEEGNALFKAGKLVEAVEKLKESYRLSKNPYLLYNIGHTYDQLGQPDLVLFYFRKFMTAAAPNAPQRGGVAKRIAELEKANVKASDPDAPVEQTKVVAGKPGVELKHDVITSTKKGTAVDITATMPDMPGATVHLFYRGSGEPTFVKEPMTRQGETLTGQIPADKTNGSSVQYYIEVRDDAGGLVTRSGKSVSPNLVLIEGSAAPIGAVEEDPFLRPRAGETPETPKGMTRLAKLTWLTTGTAVALGGTSIAMFIYAGKQHDLLVADASSCGVPPCRQFDKSYDETIETRGQRYDIAYKVTFGLSLATAGFAGYLWYRQLTAPKRSTETMAKTKTSNPTWAVAPVIGDGYSGAAAAARF